MNEIGIRPPWLPDRLRVADFEDWELFFAEVYGIFKRDFINANPRMKSKRAACDSHMEDGKERSFWHLTSSTDLETGERNIDPARCERIPWPRALIDNVADDRVSSWGNTRGKRNRLLIWLESMDFLVVLEERRNVYILITAYITDREHTRKKLRAERFMQQ